MQSGRRKRIRRRTREADGMPLAPPHGRDRAPRAVVAALIGAEAGAGFGLLFLGETPFAPIGLAAVGLVAGPLAAVGLARVHRRLVERGLRHQLRRAHRAPAPGAGHVAEP
jgi:hypothetical protein